jgi:cold shock CspA family protein
MYFLLALAMLGNMVLVQDAGSSAPSGNSSATQGATTQSEAKLKSTPDTLLAMPEGKSTVIGGTLSGVNPVLDQLTLKVFGGRPMKILFDERTLVYRDGAKMSLRDLHNNDHASVETMLDGTTVFARSIRMLSKSPEGEAQGQVMDFNPATHELTINDSLSQQPLKLQVLDTTVFRREEQAHVADGSSANTSQSAAASSDLAKGTLISIQFHSDNKGQGVAQAIVILATPGSQFKFGGTLSFLDLRLNRLVVVDSSDDKSYEVFFDSARLPQIKELHEGANVEVTAEFDGKRYIANSISTNEAVHQ